MSMVMRDYSEKRDFRRMSVDAEVEVTDSSKLSFKGTCQDLSSTGMKLYADRKVSKGDQLQISLASNHDVLSGLDADCRVLRCQPEADGYLIGVEILNIRP